MVDLKQGKITQHSAKDEVKGECTIMIKDDDFVGLASGKSNPQQVYFLKYF